MLEAFRQNLPEKGQFFKPRLIESITDIRFTFDIPRYCAQRYGESPIFYIKTGRKWQAISCKDYEATVNSLALGLLSMGIEQQENVATIFSYNCPQWNFLDMALSRIGAVHIPVYPNNSDSDYLYILKQAGVRFVFASDQIIYNKMARLQKEIKNLEKVITIEQLPFTDNLDEIIQWGLSSNRASRVALAERTSSISPDDIVSIIYTSGSTGIPKGVMLTHSNIISSMYAAATIQPVGKDRKVISFLPLCHIYERTANYQFQIKGAQLYYVETLKSLTSSLREVKPHGITVVPRVLEKVIKLALVNARQSNLIARMLVRWAIRFGFKYKPYRTRIRLGERVRHKLADLVLYSKVRGSFGGRIQYIGCGGAPLNPKVERFFWAARIPVFQGYGLTECAPLVALNFPGKENTCIGTVGKVVESMEVKIAPDGEILCKGSNVMKGYYKQPDLTEKTLVDGWLYTGDIGTFVQGDFLKITGRKKQMFKTSYGKYIVPQAIENRFVGSELIEYLIVVGEGHHCAAAVISPNFDNIRKLFSKTKNLSNARLIEQAMVKAAIQKQIEEVNHELGKSERIQKILIVPDEWSVETGELSPTLKIKRNIIQKKYSRKIQELYSKESV